MSVCHGPTEWEKGGKGEREKKTDNYPPFPLSPFPPFGIYGLHPFENGSSARTSLPFSESPIRRRRMQFHTDHVFFARLGPIYLIGVLAMLGLGVAEAQAQWATVRGRVTDQADDQPLPGAALMLHNQDDGARLGTAADGNGYFVLPRIPPGTYVLEASFIGYLSRSDTLVLAFDDAAGHDAYQDHPVHDAFRDTCSHCWAQVRIFDVQTP